MQIRLQTLVHISLPHVFLRKRRMRANEEENGRRERNKLIKIHVKRCTRMKKRKKTEKNIESEAEIHTDSICKKNKFK